MTTQTSTLTRQQEIEVQIAQELASEYARIGALFATDPVAASLEMQKLDESKRSKAAEQVKSEREEYQKQVNERKEAVNAFTGVLTSQFNTLWRRHMETAASLNHIKRWTVYVDVDEEASKESGSVVFKEPQVIAGEVQRVRTGATRSGGGGARQQPMTIKAIDTSKGADASLDGEYPSAAEAKRKVLGVETPMNRDSVASQLRSRGYEVS